MKPTVWALHALFAAVGCGLTPSRAADAADAHLLPVGPMFDVRAPIGQTYARVVEKMLFTERNWVVRYYSASEATTTGLSVIRTSDGRCRLLIKQAKPELGSVVTNAHYRKLSLDQALTMVEIESAEADIPEAVATAIHRIWLSFLRQVHADERLRVPYVMSAKVIFYSKTPDGKTLGGQMPPAGFKYANLAVLDAIVDDLFKVALGPTKDRKHLFSRIQAKARTVSRD
jgi:hypothetical protein